MQGNTSAKYLLDQISDGQIVWDPLNDEYDRVALGTTSTNMQNFPIVAGKEPFRATLKAKFPNDGAAIDSYIALLEQSRREMLGFVAFKFLPLWLTRLLISTGLLVWYTKYFKMSQRSLKDVLEGLTSNAELRAVLSYCFGDYGTMPKDVSFAMHATLVSHFLQGVSYPRGGSSEIPFHIASVITRAGGKVLP